MDRNIKALVYCSNTGNTEKYARLLSEKTGIESYPLDEALKKLEKKTPVIFLGWIMAGSVRGYKKAAGRFDVKALCAVGMSGDKGQKDDIIRQNRTGDTPVFVLQGGFDINKLRGIYRLMMSLPMKGAAKGLSEKKDRTPEEDDLLELMLNGGSRVSEENLAPVLAWLERGNRE